ncbi:MAG: FtsX-like permease family protein [Intestinibacter bartlettii]|uniref:ABC transporter permease n=1 Tax=Intestinibacter bartlettii TaxID=261299 RepID=UPI0026E9B836|nr:ABC transporter permease [Intestinibacter bartlettii]MDO5011454.1 FtsX-like permease family protein [Intestinibacter bartlettii]
MRFENNNKQIIKKISKRSLKANKTRNIFVVIAIVLTTFMLTCVFTLGISFNKNYKLMNLREIGSTANAYLNRPTQKQISKINDLDLAESIGKQITVGNVDSKELKAHNQSIELQYIDKESWNKQITPAVGNIKGNYPEKENEIMLSQSVINILGLKDVKPGDKITLNCNINKKVQKIKFVISGTYTDYSMVKRTGIDKLAYVSKDFTQKYDLSLERNGMLTIDIKDMKKDDAPDILKTNIHLNKGQTFTYLYKTSNSETNAIMTSLVMVGVISVFMVLSGYLLIYNILYIAITKDIQFYGMLKTIGASPKQIKKIVKGQGLRLSIIGIPIGIVLAIIVSFVIVPSVLEGFSAGSYYEGMMPTKAHFTPIVFIGTILFSLFTVWISSIKPAKIASRISPTEALNYTGRKNKKQKKNRKSTNGGKIHKMAWYNVFRDKKRAVLVFISLFIGIVTFLSVNTFISSLSLDNYLSKYYPHDFDIVDTTEKSSNDIDKQVKEIKNMDGVKEVNSIKFSKLQLDFNENVLMPSLENSYKLYGDPDTYKQSLADYIKQIKKNPKKLTTIVAFIDEETIEKINKSEGNKIDVKAFNDGKLALIDNFFYARDKQFDFSKEKITLRDQKNTVESTLNVQMIQNGEKDVKFTGDNQVGIPYIYVSKSLVDKFEDNKMTDWITVDCKKEYSKFIKKKLEAMIDDGYIDAKMDASENFTQSKLMMNVVGGGISLIFIFIGLLNFVNVMVTNVNTRLRELAIMESVGMTKKQIKKMLTFEGLYYALITLGMIGTLGMGIIYVIAELTQNLADYAQFVFPTNQLIFLVVVISAVCTITPRIVYKYSTKKSVIDRLREIDK